MESHQRKSNQRNTYAKISLEKRMKLIELIDFGSLSISKASQMISINKSTAKLIWKRYKEEGTYFEKRSDRLARVRQNKKAQQAQKTEEIERQPIFAQTPKQTNAIQQNNNICEQYYAYDVSLYLQFAANNGIQNYCLPGYQNFSLGGLTFYHYL